MKKKTISKNYLDSIFVPTSDLAWRNEEGSVTLDIENKGFFNRIAQSLFHQPKVSHIALDNYGSALWLLLDGENTVFDVINKMKDIFPAEQDRMLDRVITFIHTLQVNKFVEESQQTK
ncbi:MAG: PqqD family protein [Spirochaetaceae bacterium]|nr:PqqD family protein [Spirochaetaceae bacterium]